MCSRCRETTSWETPSHILLISRSGSEPPEPSSPSLSYARLVPRSAEALRTPQRQYLPLTSCPRLHPSAPISPISAGSEAGAAITSLCFSCQLKRSALTRRWIAWTPFVFNGEPSPSTTLARRDASPSRASRRSPSGQRPHANASSPQDYSSASGFAQRVGLAHDR